MGVGCTARDILGLIYVIITFLPITRLFFFDNSLNNVKAIFDFDLANIFILI